MKTLEGNIDSEMDETQLNRKILIAAQMSQPFLNKKTIYIDKLQELLDKVKTPPALHFVQALSTNPDYCSAFECYRNSHFTSSGSNPTNNHTEIHPFLGTSYPPHLHPSPQQYAVSLP